MLSKFLLLTKIDLTLTYNRIVYFISIIPLIKHLIPKNIYSEKSIFKTIFKIIIGIIGFVKFFFMPGTFFLIAFLIEMIIQNIDGASGNLNAVLYFLMFVIPLLKDSLTRVVVTDPDFTFSIVKTMKMSSYEFTVIQFVSTLIKNTLKILLLYVLMFITNMIDNSMLVCLLFGYISFSLMISLVNYTYQRNGKLFLFHTVPFFIEIGSIASFVVLLNVLFVSDNMFKIGLVLASIIGVLINIILIKRLKNINHYVFVNEMIARVYDALSRSNQSTADQKLVELNDDVTNESINSTGLKYFSELFFLRHKKFLVRPVFWASIAILVVFVSIVMLIFAVSKTKSFFTDMFLNNTMIIILVCYYMNQSETMTKAMFYNCDHAMLFYRFYRTPKNILSTFFIRIVTLIKYNAIVSLVLGVCCAIILLLCGSTDYVQIIALFFVIQFAYLLFSIHYLVAYYLFQPYNISMEMKILYIKFLQLGYTLWFIV